VAHSGNTVRTRKQREVDIIYLALVTRVIVNTLRSFRIEQPSSKPRFRPRVGT
jgi:hypothetical protein